MAIQVTEVSVHDYAASIRAAHVYNSTDFTHLNAAKVSSIFFLLFGDTRLRAGITLGERADGSLVSGFSSPFGGFDTTREQEPQKMVEICEALARWADGRRLEIVMPPERYFASQNAKTRYALSAAGFTEQRMLNHHIDVTRSPTALRESLDSKARNKLRMAERAQFSFSPCGADEAYEIIAANRAMRGYPLAMSLNDVKSTSRIVKSEFFILRKGETGVAAAMLNSVTPDIKQLVYWGDNGLEAESHPMNMLAYELAGHYFCSGCKTRLIDLGPSGSYETLNNGLMAFKESVGGEASLKHRFLL